MFVLVLPQERWRSHSRCWTDSIEEACRKRERQRTFSDDKDADDAVEGDDRDDDEQHEEKIEQK